MRKPISLGWIILCGAILTAQAAEASVSKQTLTIALSTEPPQLNGTKATDSESFFILGHTMEGLLSVGKDKRLAPGVAETWEVTDTGAVFHLRKDAKWSDGKAVTAHDFVFAWRTAVDPKNASEYAFILYPVKNAEAINTKKRPVKDLGVVAIDNATLKVTFEKPCGYFLSLMTFPTYFPLREDFYQSRGERYGAEATDILANGAFILTKWMHGASLRMEKNKNYWNQKAITLEAIDIPFITPDDSARFNLFKDHKIDIVGLNKDTLGEAQKENLKLKRFSDGTVFYLEFNFKEGRPTRNLALRKAIAAVFDSEQYVNKVVGIPGTKVASSVIPSWVMGQKQTFRKEHPLPTRKPDLAAAKIHLAQALKEMQTTQIPPLVWLTGDSPTASREAEYFQSLLKTALGIDLKIDKQIFKQRLAKMTAGDFDIVSAGWGPDYNDPMTFADLKTSWNENNRGRWVHKKYDEWIRKAQGTTQVALRMGAMAEAEKIALAELPLLPLYERSVIYSQNESLQGVVRKEVGFDPDYRFARFE